MTTLRDLLKDLVIQVIAIEDPEEEKNLGGWTKQEHIDQAIDECIEFIKERIVG